MVLKREFFVIHHNRKGGPVNIRHDRVEDKSVAGPPNTPKEKEGQRSVCPDVRKLPLKESGNICLVQDNIGFQKTQHTKLDKSRESAMQEQVRGVFSLFTADDITTRVLKTPLDEVFPSQDFVMSHQPEEAFELQGTFQHHDLGNQELCSSGSTT